MQKVKETVFIIHDFDGHSYYRALEVEHDLIYLNSRPFRFLIRDLIKYKRLKSETLSSLVYFFTIPFRRRENIILAMAPYNFRFIFYSFLSKKNKVIYHTSWPYWDSVTPFYYHRILNLALKRVWAVGLKRFHKNIAVTVAAQKSLSNFLGEPVIHQIYHVVDCAEISQDLASEKWGKSTNVGFLGRVCSQKGIELFIELSNRLVNRGINFYVAGGGLRADIKVVEGESCFREDFSYVGFLSDRSKVRMYLSGLNFLILPSLRSPKWEELFGLVIIEAMSQGVVVITTDHVGPCEIINQGVDGFVLSESEFVEKAVKIIKNSQNNYCFKTISQNAILKARVFSKGVIVKKWRFF